MWRFSYLTAEKGGAAFVALTLLFTAVVGLPVMLAELSVGRGSQKSPIQALAHYGGGAWRWLGGVFVASGFLILAYYGVIAGWALRYLGASMLGSYAENPGAYFTEVSQGLDSLGFQVVFMAGTIAVVSGGVKGGIERVASWMMPVLFLMVLGIAAYAFTLDGSGAGYSYYLNMNIDRIWDRDVVVAAAGHAFFSLSLGMGAMLTFASYLSPDDDLVSESYTIASVDFGVAFMAGMMIFPLIFALGLQSEIIGKDTGTLGALFVAVPKAFATMGFAGRIVGSVFFFALVVGALTSALSLLEVVVSATIDGLGWERRKAALVMGSLVTLLGAPAAFDTNTLGVMDTLANNVFLMGGGLGLAIFTGWVMRDPVSEAGKPNPGGRSGLLALWLGLLRYVVPVILIALLIASAETTWNAVLSLFG